jgi:Radical SAM superfamily
MVQIEITTRCNYSCWYCTGRDMEQEDMSWDTFTSIVDKIPSKSIVKLQGEGEPTLWKHWWEGVAYIAERGHFLTSIINGTNVDVEKFTLYFSNLGVSIDSIDPDVANEIGRFNVKKVQQNLLLLKKHMKSKLVAYITDIGQDLTSTKQWLQSNNIAYVLQPLMAKTDYVAAYPADKKFTSLSRLAADKPKTCEYLFDENKLKFFTIKGQELPCCFIKQPEGFSADVARDEMNQGIVPSYCTGCRYLK